MAQNTWIIIISVLIIGATVAGGLYFYQQRSSTKINTQPSLVPTNPTSAPTTTTEVSGWNTYKNEQYAYEVKYPKDWYFMKDACCPPPPTGVTLNNYSENKDEFAAHQTENNVYNVDILCDYEGALEQIGEVKLLKEEGKSNETLKVNGFDSIKFTEEELISYYIVNGKSGCRIGFKKSCEICQKVLSTFKFSE